MKSFLISCLLFCFVSYSWAQPGYNIKINIKPFQKQYIYLGYHYGKKKALADSTILDENSNGLFTGTKPLNGGIYFIVRGLWAHAFLWLIFLPMTYGISWVIYPFFAPSIVRRQYLRAGWIELPKI